MLGQHALSVCAPGKAVLLGEYAVLEGAPALVQAIDRRARVRVRPIEGRECRLTALPLNPQPVAFGYDAGGRVHWRQAAVPAELGFAERLLNLLGPWSESGGAAVELELDTREFFDPDGVKLGLGSSAALAVTLAGAWYAARHGRHAPLPERWLATLIALHRELQGGRGSGVDVAASLHGGLVRFMNGAEGPDVRRLQAVAGVEWMWISLGRSASTADFLGRLEAFAAAAPGVCGERMGELARLAGAGAAAAEAGDSVALLNAIGEYGGAMEHLGQSAGIPVYTDDHRRLERIARRCGAVFKPSGAGGGDIALAAAADAEALAALARQIAAAGYRVLALGPAGQGLTIE